MKKDCKAFSGADFQTPIANCFAGVYMVNVPMPNVYANDINLKDALLPGVRGAGIFGYACHSAVINNNVLGSYAGGFLKSKIGIGIDNSSASAIDDNDISDYGDGIFVSGYCWQTTYNCNRMFDYGRGVVYNFAIVGPQGDFNQPQGNQWTPNLMDGNAELFSFNVATTWDFWYQSNAGAAFVPAEFIGAPFGFTLKPTSSSSNCSFQRNQNLNPIVKRQQGFDQWPTERTFGNHSWAQKSLNRSTALLASSQDYQVYRDSVDTTALGGLARYESALMDGDFSLAQQMQPGLAWTSPEERTLSDLLSIGQVYFQVGSTGLSVGDWAIIDSLASSEVEPNHMIVSAARAMKMYHDQVPLFNWVEDDSYSDTTVARFKNEGKAAKAIGYEIQVYPIPADELMTISNPLEESLLCVLVGLDGKEVHRFEILYGENELNVSNFPAGVYFLNVNGKSYSKTVKVVIE